MITVYYSKFEKITKREENYCMNFIEEKHLKNLKNYNKKRKLEIIYGRYMIKSILSKLLNEHTNRIEIKENKLGKLYVPNCRYKFNLSHSKKYLFLCISDGINVGIDAEEINFNRTSMLNFALNSEEKDMLRKLRSNEQRMRFAYKVWTKKEAFLKLQGTGFVTPPSEIYVNEIDYHYYFINFQEVVVAICTKQNKDEFSKMKFLPFNFRKHLNEKEVYKIEK
jgi:4'-phosphopantetheinyl transferase